MRSGLPINALRITNQRAQDYQSTRSGLPINTLRITNQHAQDYQSTLSGLPINTLRYNIVAWRTQEPPLYVSVYIARTSSYNTVKDPSGLL